MPPAITLAIVLAAATGISPEHRLELKLDPTTRSVIARDRVMLAGAAPRFALNRGLVVVQVEADGRDATERIRKEERTAGELLGGYTLEGTPPSEMVIHYGGTLEVPQPVLPPALPAPATSARSAGARGQAPEVASTSSNAPLLLSPSLGFYPLLRAAARPQVPSHEPTEPPARFTVVAELPPGFTCLSQAAEVARSESKWSFSSEEPAAGLSLVVGRYVARTVSEDGIALTMALLEPADAALSDRLLERVLTDLKRVSAYSGPYPWKRLDLVELPGEAGVAPGLVHLSPEALRARDLPDVDRSIARLWWGTLVKSEPGGGDWTEGLAAYLSEHAAREAEGEASVRRFRAAAAARLTALAGGADDIALDAFHPGRSQAGDDLGRLKGELVLHVLRRALGDDAFAAGLRLVAERHGGSVARWEDLRKAFEESASTPLDLRAWFEQWVRRTGLPEISLVAGDGGDVRVAQPPWRAYDLLLPLVFEREGERKAIEVSVPAQASTPVGLGAEKPDRVVLDPGFDVPRRITPRSPDASLARTFGEKDLRVVYPAKGALAARYRALADDLARTHRGRAVVDTAASPDDLSGPIVLLGGPVDNAAARAVLPPSSELAFARDGVGVGGRLFREPETLVVWSVRRPSGVPLTLVHALSTAALEDAGKRLESDASPGTTVVLTRAGVVLRDEGLAEEAVTLTSASRTGLRPLEAPTALVTDASSRAPSPTPKMTPQPMPTPTPPSPLAPAPSPNAAATAPPAPTAPPGPTPETPLAASSSAPREGVPGDALRDLREVRLRNVRQLTKGGSNTSPSWSADGSALAFVATRPPLKCDQVYRLTLPDGEMTLVSTGSGRAAGPSFLPSGLRVLYASTHLARADCPPGPSGSGAKIVWPLYEYDLFTTRLDRTGLVQLTSQTGYDAEASVSHDGSRVLFTSIRDGDLELYTMAADGSDVRRLTSTAGYDGSASFSPDDRLVVELIERPQTPDAVARFKALLGANLVEPRSLAVAVRSADGTGIARTLTPTGTLSFSPGFSPDGKRVVFSSDLSEPGEDALDLYVVSTDGSGLERITFDPAFDGWPAFSPDGKHLAWSSGRNATAPGETNLFLADWVE